jgi:nuclear pore complex protein Nup205
MPTGNITIDGDEYSVSEQFQQSSLFLSDEADIDEIEAAKCLLDAQEDPAILGRPLLECGIIRYHQQRNYVLDCVRMFLELFALDDEDLDKDVSDAVELYVAGVIFKTAPKNIVPRCMAAMQRVKSWLQKVGDRITAASVMAQARSGVMSEEMETIEFSRVSLVQQHELLGVILCRAVEHHQSKVEDFASFLQILKKADKYDPLLGKESTQ